MARSLQHAHGSPCWPTCSDARRLAEQHPDLRLMSAEAVCDPCPSFPETPERTGAISG